jgi:hypothetical protein
MPHATSTSADRVNFRFLPCVVYGRTRQRLSGDPNLQNGSCVNGDCVVFCLLCHVHLAWPLEMLLRGEVRRQYGIKGNGTFTYANGDTHSIANHC